MYKPLLLGISNADPWGLLIFIFAIIAGVSAIADMAIFFTCLSILKLIRWAYNQLMKNKQQKSDDASAPETTFPN
jgi:hypothetical protein